MSEQKRSAKKAATRRAEQRAEQPIEAYFGSVESKTPGRTRIRVKKELRSKDAMAQIQQELTQHEDVKQVTVNAQTGSIVIEHTKHREGHAIFKEALKDVELVGGVLLEVPVAEEEGDSKVDQGGGEYARVDNMLSDLASRVDEWQAQYTHIHGRGFLLSGTIAGLGVLQIAVVGITWELLPGPVLLYIAYDIHRRVTKEEKEMEARKQGAQQAGDESKAPKSNANTKKAPLPAAA